MTTVLDTPPAAPLSATAAITPREAWRKAKLPAALGLAFVVLAILQALTTGTITAGYMDPEAAGPHGGLALATLLRDRGIDVSRVPEPSGAPGTTVFVPVPALVRVERPFALNAMRNSIELVVAEPDEFALEAMRVDAGVAGDTDVHVLDPACSHEDARAAGDVRLGGVTFGAPETAQVCYVDRGDASFVELRDGGRRVTLLGTASFMTNQYLDDHGDAALALRLLSRHQTVEWVYPRTTEAVREQERSLYGLLPHRLFVFVAEVCVVLLLLALWRARRLGPVVVEPLPVVVRAAEAVEGRARLYESAKARDQAANALRAGLRDRLVRVLGLAADASQDALVAAVTDRTRRDAVAVATLLYGPPPVDDAALVRLAADLDQLDTEVRAL